jgi:hypothetical protein
VKKPLEFFQFLIAGVDPATGDAVKGALKDFAIGTYSDARKKAEEFERQCAEQEPDRKMKVTAVGLERVGPMIQRQLTIIMAAAEQNRVAAEMLAARLAEYTARESLEIRPNLSQIADCLLDEARKAALFVLKEGKAAIVEPEARRVTL